jgi:hypothetical protein
MNTCDLFCANDQKETAHVLDVDGNGEVVLTCPCGRFIKLPAGADAAGIRPYADAHRASNEGQITQEAIAKKKADLLASLNK